MKFAWALEYPEVLNVCKKFSLNEVSNPKQVTYKQLPCIIQQGPQCGLVALSIGMGSATRETIYQLFSEAQKSNFTINGEMFSATDMLELTRKFLSNNITLYEGVLNSQEIREFLLMGGLLLVPYDSSNNHYPCQVKGHKAHWALLVGIIECDITYVIARHGKSMHIAIWELSILSDSNQQLDEFSPSRKGPELLYKLPDGGIGGINGLKSKAICIWPGVDS